MCLTFLPLLSFTQLTVQTLFAFPTISNEISSIVLVENSDKLRKAQEEKLESRIRGRQVDLSWVDKIDDIPECKSTRVMFGLTRSGGCIHDRHGSRVL